MVFVLAHVAWTCLVFESACFFTPFQTASLHQYLSSQDSSSVGIRSVVLSPCLATNALLDVSTARSHSSPPHVLFDALHSNLAASLDIRQSDCLAAMLHQCSQRENSRHLPRVGLAVCDRLSNQNVSCPHVYTLAHPVQSRVALFPLSCRFVRFNQVLLN